MSAPDDRRQALRAEREARAQSEHDSDRHRSRLIRLGVVAVIAAIVVVVAIVVSQSGETEPGGDGLAESSREVERMFAGIPQEGLSLGDPDAPAAMVEFADLQCPFCAEYARQVLPAVIERYVRPGRLRLEFRPLTFVGPDSRRAALVAAAASRQNRLWQFTELVFANQGIENSGYVTDEYLRRIAEATPGLDAQRALAESEQPAAAQVLEEAEGDAMRLRVDTTPSFFVSERGGAPRPLVLTDLSAESFTRTLDEALGGG